MPSSHQASGLSTVLLYLLAYRRGILTVSRSESSLSLSRWSSSEGSLLDPYMENNGTIYLNPNTSLAFLPPELAIQLEATRYLTIASLAVIVWDLLSNLSQDYHLLTKNGTVPPTIAYFFSRFSSLAHIVATTVFHIVPVGPGWCQRLPRMISWFWVVAISSTSLLFLFRIRAVFNGRPWIIRFFVLLWLANLGGSITVPFALYGGNIPYSDRCVPTSVKPFSSTGIITTAVNDTLVFFAISCRIIMDADPNGKFRFIRGQSLPYISRELLRGGQQYYLITVGGNIFVMAMLLSPSTPPLLRDMFPVINMALENSMACRVFRRIKFSRRDLDHNTLKLATINTSLHPTTSQLPPVPLRSLYGGGREAVKPSESVLQIAKTDENFPDDRSMEMFNKDDHGVV